MEWIGIDMLMLALIYLVYLLPRWTQRREAVLKSVLCVYGAGVLYFTIMPIYLPIPFLTLPMDVWNINLMPFSDLILHHAGALREFLLNVLMMVPLGILVPFIYKKGFARTVLLCLCCSLCIELVQLFSITKLNCCDITDLISNTLGGACGYGLYMLFRAPLKHLYALLFFSALAALRALEYGVHAADHLVRALCRLLFSDAVIRKTVGMTCKKERFSLE